MNTAHYYYAREGQQFGPVTLEQLNSLAATGQLRATDLVWRMGAPAWEPAEKCTELVFPPPLPPLALPAVAPPPQPGPVPPREPGSPLRVGSLTFIRGPVLNVRRSVEAWGDQHEAGTSQIVTFMLNSQAVEVNMSKLPQIEPGDDVAVAGAIKGGTLHARAFKNWSNGTYDSWSTGFNYGCSAGLPLVIIGVLFPPALILGVPFAAIGSWLMISSIWKNSTSRALVGDPNQV